jgi:hypothetical protein
MRKITVGLVVAVVLSAVLATGGCGSQKRVALWNGKDFAGWKLFVPNRSVNVHSVWSVKDGVIHCKGQPNGYMRTQVDYSDYKLHLEWRWVEQPTNSGVLLHASGPDKVWPRCIESQLKSGNAGDFVLIGGTGINVGGRFIQDVSRQYVIVPKRQQSSEKTPGRWNTYDIICRGDTILNYVNGVLQNEGTNATETSGKICLQSEGSPIEFRNIYIESLD